MSLIPTVIQRFLSDILKWESGQGSPFFFFWGGGVIIRKKKELQELTLMINFNTSNIMMRKKYILDPSQIVRRFPPHIFHTHNNMETTINRNTVNRNNCLKDNRTNY